MVSIWVCEFLNISWLGQKRRPLRKVHVPPWLPNFWAFDIPPDSLVTGQGQYTVTQAVANKEWHWQLSQATGSCPVLVALWVQGSLLCHLLPPKIRRECSCRLPQLASVQFSPVTLVKKKKQMFMNTMWAQKGSYFQLWKLDFEANLPFNLAVNLTLRKPW